MDFSGIRLAVEIDFSFPIQGITVKLPKFIACCMIATGLEMGAFVLASEGSPPSPYTSQSRADTQNVAREAERVAQHAVERFTTKSGCSSDSNLDEETCCLVWCCPWCIPRIACDTIREFCTSPNGRRTARKADARRLLLEWKAAVGRTQQDGLISVYNTYIHAHESAASLDSRVSLFDNTTDFNNFLITPTITRDVE